MRERRNRRSARNQYDARSHGPPKESDEEGGLSGEPLRGRATQLLRILNATMSLPLIGLGGVMVVLSAKEKFDAGAALVEIYTGLVYRGPQLVRKRFARPQRSPQALLNA